MVYLLDCRLPIPPREQSYHRRQSPTLEESRLVEKELIPAETPGNLPLAPAVALVTHLAAAHTTAAAHREVEVPGTSTY